MRGDLIESLFTFCLRVASCYVAALVEDSKRLQCCKKLKGTVEAPTPLAVLIRQGAPRGNSPFFSIFCSGDMPCYPVPMGVLTQRIMKRTDFAALAGVNPSAVTRACLTRLRDAVIGKRIDVAHPLTPLRP